jgi:hypothetical protein
MARQGYIRSVPVGRGGIAVVKALYVNLVELGSVQKRSSS